MAGSGVRRPGRMAAGAQGRWRAWRPEHVAGVAVRVVDACRLPVRPGDVRQHLEVELALDRDAVVAADVLAASGVVVVRDRQPMIVQQHPGRPQDGWNGVLSASGSGGSRLGLTLNGVAVDGTDPVGGWSGACPTP